MSNYIKTSPDQIHEDIRSLAPGSRLKLGKGRYTTPIVVSAKYGTQDDPIVIRGKRARVGPGQTYEDYRVTANQLSAVQEAGGRFPGVYYLADNASLVLRDCQWVVIEDLSFDGCWPTAIYIDNCQHITLRRLSIRGSTIAIGAAGAYTRHLMIEECDWIQDVSGHGEADLTSIRKNERIRADLQPDKCLLWRKTNWEQVHGSLEDDDGKRVSIEDDARAFDGDFFRAWTIAGYVVIRKNVIVDAFNAVHFFNQSAASITDASSRNVVIEDNWFVRIRDNAIEAEQFAWNWTVRRNKFVDCYMPFSLEMERSGFFYIYGNLGWNFHRPGPDNDERNFGQLFKFPTDHKADGPHYFFHNSWLTRGPICKKKRFSQFHHLNNTIGYYEQNPQYTPEAAVPFGSACLADEQPSPSPGEIKELEKNRFTKLWHDLDIHFDGDVIDHPDYPEKLRQAGYPIGPHARGGPIAFRDRAPGAPKGLKSIKTMAAIAFRIQLPDKQEQDISGPNYQTGAWQGKELFAVRGPLFYDSWLRPSCHDDG